jgi:hypothetical protein
MPVTINHSSELMKNQQHAVVLAPETQFQVLQTTTANSLFFSIGSDDVFYCTRELPANTLGWSRTNLISAIASDYPNEAIVAKSFNASQNLSAGNIDIALVITVNNADYLYTSLGNSCTDEAWANAPAWALQAYDDALQPMTTLNISDIYVAQAGKSEYVVADIMQPATENALRYYINTAAQKGSVWTPSYLAANLEGGTISNLLGHVHIQTIDGMYTLGSISNLAEVIYTPLYNAFGSGAPTPIRLQVPATTTAMALSVNANGDTDLFVAANGALYFIASKDQKDQASLAAVYTHPILAGVTSLHVNNWNNTVVVWGLNGLQQMFYLKTTLGSEAVTGSWSYPLPLLTGVDSIASFLNNTANNSVMFAATTQGGLLQLMQDPVTTAWQQRNILLPPTDVNDLVENYTYTTHISFADENNLPQQNLAATITTTSPCSVYINNNYSVLSATSALQVTSDTTGVITVVQQVNGIAGICYNLTSGGQTVNINPMLPVMTRLQSQNITPGTQLSAINVTDEQGNSTPLVGSAISTQDQQQAAQALSTCVPYIAAMPQDGSVKAVTGSTVSPQANTIEVIAGDVWQWLKHAAQDVESFTTQVIGDVTHFFLTIGSDIYHFVVRCMSDVAHGIEFVLEKIAVGLDDMVKWIGFIFAWDDIVRTHQVLRNVILQYINKGVAGISNTITGVQNTFSGIESALGNWSNVPSLTGTYGSISAASGSSTAQNTPQAGWSAYHTQNNAANANFSYTAPGIPSSVTGALSDLVTMLESEKTVVTNTYNQVKALIDELPTLTVTQVITALKDILEDSLLQTAENVITTFLNILKDILTGVADVLDAPLNIPVISAMYKKYTKDDLSLLDLACLIAAVPVTVVYKIVHNVAPFPDNAATTALINAADFSALQTVCTDPPSAVSTAAVTAPVLPPPTPGTLMYTLTFAGNVAGAGGATVLAGLSFTKTLYTENPLFGVLNAAFYLPYVAPDILGSLYPAGNNQWYGIANTAIAEMAVVKAVADMMFWKNPGGGVSWYAASPWIDFFLNVAWQVPTTDAVFHPENQNLGGMLAYIGGTLFDMSGVLSPVIAMNVQPVSIIAAGASSYLNLGYAGTCLAQAILSWPVSSPPASLPSLFLI